MTVSEDYGDFAVVTTDEGTVSSEYDDETEYIHFDEARERCDGSDWEYGTYVYIFGDEQVGELQEFKCELAQDFTYITGVVLPAELEALRPLSDDEVEACIALWWQTGESATVEDIEKLRSETDG